MDFGLCTWICKWVKSKFKALNWILRFVSSMHCYHRIILFLYSLVKCHHSTEHLYKCDWRSWQTSTWQTPSVGHHRPWSSDYLQSRTPTAKIISDNYLFFRYALPFILCSQRDNDVVVTDLHFLSILRLLAVRWRTIMYYIYWGVGVDNNELGAPL